MFYANGLFTCGLAIFLLSVNLCQYSKYGTFMMVVGIIIMFIGTVSGLNIEYDNNMKIKELKSLVEAQIKQIQLLKEEIDTLKHR
nr:MAG TPA: cell division protein [Caudoviricetes sp.]